MTNTLHRFGDAQSFRDDFIVFAMASRGINDDGLVEKYRAFLRLALKHHPVNIGDATKGGMLRPRQDLNPQAHWRRDHRSDPEAVIAGIEGHTTAAAVFDNYQNMKAFVEDVQRVAQTYFTPENRLVMHILPRGAATQGAK